MLTKTKKTKRKVRKASGARRPLKAVRGVAGVNAVVNNMSSERESLIPETGRAAPERSLGGEGASVSPIPGEGMEKASASKNNRTCFVTRKILPKERLLRFVLGPGRILAFDLNNKLPGRGYWLCCDGFVVRQALSKNLFQKAMRGTVKIPEGFEEQIAETESMMAEPGFWDDSQKAQTIIDKSNQLKAQYETFNELTTGLENLQLMVMALLMV